MDKNQRLLINLPSGTYIARIMNNIQSMMGLYVIDATGSRLNILELNKYSSNITVSFSSPDKLIIENQLYVVNIALFALNRSINLNNIDIQLESIG